MTPDGLNDTVVSDHLGKWEYKVVSPDVTYNGILEFEGKVGAYSGTLKSDGNTITLTDITFEDSMLKFKMNVQGYPCVVRAKIDKDALDGEVEVEGFYMPLTASRM